MVWVGRHTSSGRGLGVFVVVGVYFIEIHRISMHWLVGGVKCVVDATGRVHRRWRGGRRCPDVGGGR